MFSACGHSWSGAWRAGSTATRCLPNVWQAIQMQVKNMAAHQSMQIEQAIQTWKPKHGEILTQLLFTHRSRCTVFFHRESFYTDNFLYTDHLFHTQRQLHREFVAQRGPYTEKVAQNFLHREPFHTDFLTQKGFYTQKLVRREVFTQRSFYSESLPLHGEVFTHSKFLHREAFTQINPHIQQVFTHRSVYTEKFLYKQLFPQGSVYTKRLHGEAFTCSSAGFYTVKRYTAILLLKRSVYPWNLPRTKCNESVAPKPDLGAKAKKEQFWSIFWNFKRRNIISAKCKNKSAETLPWQPWGSHRSAICKDGVAKHKSTVWVNTERRKPLGDLSYGACAVRTGVEPRATMPASVVASESTCLRTRTSFYPKQANVSRKSWVTFKSHPWCSSSTGIYARWVTKHNWIATLYSTASSFGAAVPLHKAPQHLQSHQGTSFTVRA